jgi:type II secretory pathway component PulM
MAIHDTVRESWEKLTDRERQMLAIMASVLVFLVVLIAVWRTSTALAEVEEERDEIRKVLTEIERSGEELSKRDAERKAAEARYRQKPPPLAAFLEGKAKAEGLDVRQLVEQPAKEVDGYRRQQVRLNFSSVSLRPIVRLLAAIEGEQMAIAIERVQLEHYQSGDTYNAQIGVIALEKKQKGKAP